MVDLWITGFRGDLTVRGLIPHTNTNEPVVAGGRSTENDPLAPDRLNSSPDNQPMIAPSRTSQAYKQMLVSFQIDQAKLGKEMQAALREKEDEAAHWKRMYSKVAREADNGAGDDGENGGSGAGAGTLEMYERIRLQAEVSARDFLATCEPVSCVAKKQLRYTGWLFMGR